MNFLVRDLSKYALLLINLIELQMILKNPKNYQLP